jgi:hypothetical protein
MVNNANIGGNKASQFVQESYRLETNITDDGTVENTLHITYQHNGDWEWPSNAVFNYQRIYVPLGSQLIESAAPEAEGGKEGITEVYQDLGKTVFADYIRIYPGGTVNVSYKYTLPYKVGPADRMTYRSLIQKQPGTLDIPLERIITYDGFVIEPLHAGGELMQSEEDKVAGTLVLNTDHAYEIVFRKHDVL